MMFPRLSVLFFVILWQNQFKLHKCILPSELQWFESAQQLPSADFGSWGGASAIFNDTLFVIGGNRSYVKWITLDDLHSNKANPSAWNITSWPYDSALGWYWNYMYSFSAYTIVDNYMYLASPWGWWGYMLIYNLETKSPVSASEYEFEMPYNTSEPCMYLYTCITTMKRII